MKVSAPETRGSLSPSAGVLKAIVVSPSLCVAIAGRPEPGLHAVQEVYRSQASNDDVVSLLSDAHQKCEQKTDFIVAFVGPPPSLVRIRDGAVEKGLIDAWIGDPPAFEKYQEYLAGLAGMTDHLPYKTGAIADMGSAFQMVIEDAQIPSVGGFRIAAASYSSHISGFHYLRMSAGYGFRPVSAVEPDSLLQLPEPPQLGYHYSMLVPATAGIGAIGVHTLESHWGVLFYPRCAEKAIPYRGVSLDDFIERVQDEHGFFAPIPSRLEYAGS